MGELESQDLVEWQGQCLEVVGAVFEVDPDVAHEGHCKVLGVALLDDFGPDGELDDVLGNRPPEEVADQLVLVRQNDILVLWTPYEFLDLCLRLMAGDPVDELYLTLSLFLGLIVVFDVLLVVVLVVLGDVAVDAEGQVLVALVLVLHAAEDLLALFKDFLLLLVDGPQLFGLFFLFPLPVHHHFDSSILSMGHAEGQFALAKDWQVVLGIIHFAILIFRQ